MQSVSVTFYDGVVSKPHHATLFAQDGQHIKVQYFDETLKQVIIHQDQMSLIGAIGQRFPVIELKNEARIEFKQLEIPDWVPVKHQGINRHIWKLERTPLLIIFSLVFMVALGFSVLKWGIPKASEVVAYQLPENSLERLGGQAEEYVNKITEKTQLSKARQDKIRQDYLKYVAKDKPANLKFRAGGQIGANALALPNNTIIMTDELIELAHSDQEIIGVLAHEQAHILYRHSLQQALSSLGMSVLFVAITGDSSDLFVTLPAAIAGADYSRKFENEADLYALKVMHEQNIQPSHFANLLQRMSEEFGEEKKTNSLLDIFSSHPNTEDRVKVVREFEAEHAKK